MKEELTSLMHLEFCRDEEERIEMAACGVYFDVNKHGKDLTESLKRYGITKEQYEENKPY
jgi:hypothetical protein